MFALLPVVIAISLLLAPYNGADPFTHDLGWNLLIEAVSIILTVFVINTVLGRSERTRWKKLKDTVLEKLSREISGVESNLALMLLPPFEIENANLSKEEIVEKVNQDTQDKLAELASAGVQEIFKLVNRYMIGHRSIRFFGPLLRDRAETLGTFVDRYSAHLEPDLQAHLVTLEDSLKQASSGVDMATRFITGKRSIGSPLQWLLFKEW